MCVWMDEHIAALREGYSMFLYLFVHCYVYVWECQAGRVCTLMYVSMCLYVSYLFEHLSTGGRVMDRWERGHLIPQGKFFGLIMTFVCMHAWMDGWMDGWLNVCNVWMCLCANLCLIKMRFLTL